MQLPMTRPITDKFLNVLALLHHLPSFGSSRVRSQSKWRNLLPIREAAIAVSYSNWKHEVLEEAARPRKRPRKVGFIKISSACRLNSSQSLIGERLSCSLINVSGVRQITKWKSNSCPADDLGASELRASGRKLGRRYRLNEEDGGGYKKCRSSKSTGKEGEHCNSDVGYDAILVLAGGQVAEGGVPVWVERRLDKALDLQRSKNGELCKIVCLGGGTPHRAPILSSEGFVVHESSSCAEYLHSRGAPFSHVVKEWGSYDTIGNGYFSLTQHVIPRRWRTLAVVTSEFHMPRTKAIFEWIFGLQGAGLALQQGQLGFEDVVATTGSKAQGFQLEFHSVSDHGSIEESIAEARLKRERSSIENLRVVSRQIRSLEDFHEWFHTEHKAYNTEDQHLFGKEDKTDPALLSY